MKEKDRMDKDQMNQISGGCGTVNMIIGDPQCECSGVLVNMIAFGTDSSGRITFYRCPLCGATENVYG